MNTESTEVATISNILPVNQQNVAELKQQRALLGDFVRSQLKEANFTDSKSASFGDGDYGIIPGTKKMCLLKPGAEKLLRLFGLGVRFKQTDKVLDRAANFALYTYNAEIFVMSSGLVVAECEATANSQEKKWKERTEWKKNSRGVGESTKVETPIYDVINTLQKMAQKRALVGATILATGASEYFTQDVLEHEDHHDSFQPTPQQSHEHQSPQPKAEPKDVQSEVIEEEAPTCCGRPMMISKYADKDTGQLPFYCTGCKKKIPRRNVD